MTFEARHNRAKFLEDRMRELGFPDSKIMFILLYICYYSDII